MKLHELKRKTKNKKKRTVGRGGKHAKTSGRGTKGQKARAGRKLRPELRDMIKKLPKRRGRGKNIFQSYEIRPAEVSLAKLALAFKSGDTVSPETLKEKKLIKNSKGKTPIVKILNSGSLDIKLTISGCKISKGAKAVVEKAGGSVE